MTGAVPLIVLGELPGCSVGEAQFILWYLRGKRLTPVSHPTAE
jgi:hypothetical protein